MLIQLVEKWLDEVGIQHIHGAIPDTIMVSARCWTCAPQYGRFVGLEEDNGDLTVDQEYGRPIERIPAADPQLFMKLVVALRRCEHMPKVRVEGISI